MARTPSGPRSFGSRLLATFASVLGVVVGAGSAHAIVINDTAGAAAAIAKGTPFAAVTEIFIGGGFCSGALIDPTHVITAQHCTFGASTGSMTVNFHTDNDGVADHVRAVSAKAEVDATNVLLDGTDMAILTLAAAAPGGITPLKFFAENPVGRLAVMVGFGLNGLGSVGHQNTRDGLRWAAENIIDQVGPARGTSGDIAGSANIINTDFDDGTAANNHLGSATPVTLEGTTAPGDSGGPILICKLVSCTPDQYLIAGVLSGGTTATSIFGDISWWTGVVQHRAFIEAQAPGAAFVPTPGTLAVLMTGLLALGLARRRQSV